MIGDKAKGVIIDNTYTPKPSVRICFSKSKKPLQLVSETRCHPFKNDDLVLTNGLYYLRYDGNRFKKSNKLKNFKFVIVSDLLAHNKYRVSGWKDFLKMCKEDERLNRLRELSNISEKLFEIAAYNPCCTIPFQFKVEEYYDYLLSIGSDEYFCLKYREEFNVDGDNT